METGTSNATSGEFETEVPISECQIDLEMPVELLKSGIEKENLLEDSDLKNVDSFIESEHETWKSTVEPVLTSDMRVLEIFYKVCDVSQSFKLDKYLIKESSIDQMIENCPVSMKVIAIYGISSVMKKFLSLVFEEQITLFPETEGIYLFYNSKKSIGVFAYITPNEEIYLERPMKSSNSSIVIIRTLTDLSQKIVACISEEMIENWFYEDKGTLNPFNSKTHSSGGAVVGEVTQVESDIKEIRLLNNCQSKIKFYLANDNINLFFYCDFEIVNQADRMTASKSLLDFPDELLKLNDESLFQLKINELLGKMKSKTFNATEITYELKKHFDQLILEKKKALFESIKSLAEVIEHEFRYIGPRFNEYKYFWGNYKINSFANNEGLSDLEIQIKNALTNITLPTIENLSNQILSKLKSNIKFLNENIFKEFAKEYFVKYLKNSNLKQLKKIVDSLVDDIKQKFNVRNFVNKYLGVKKKTLESFKKDLADILFKNRSMNLDKFCSECEMALIDLIDIPESQILKKIVNQPLLAYTEKLKIIYNSFRSDCESTLKAIESTFSGKQLCITKAEFSINEKGFKNEKELVCSIMDSQALFKEFLRYDKICISQIIGLDERVFFVFVSNPELGVTHVIRFNSKIRFKEDVEVCADIPDPDVKLAWGSSAYKYIMFQNKNRKATEGSLKMNRHLQEGLNLEVYSKVGTVINSYYMKKSRRLYIIDETGLLFCRELVNTEGETYLVNSCKRVENSEKFEPLKPSTGTKFLNIDVSADENIIFLLSEVEIECFDKNFIKTHSLSITKEFSSFKTFTVENQCFLLIQNNNLTIKCLKVIAPVQKTFIKSFSNKITKIIEGNPIFDVHQLGITKFGPISEETQKIKGSRSLGYYSIGNKNKKVLDYLRALKQVQQSFDNIGHINPNKIFKDINLFDLSEIIFTIRTRIPIHIASIQNGNLIPLQNGINNFEEFTRNLGKAKESFSETLTDYIRFGHYEDILQGIKGFLVVSIIGRQSSGKSYLLNRLAGTRFDVAAERCTEGLWMGIGFINDTPLIVFDCEGLFTVERSTQEEIKLCLFISSLSDLIILNTDLSSGKHIKKLFDEFGSGVDRLKGKNLFNGNLDITYRDIPSNQHEGANKEFNNFLQGLLDTGKRETLFKLFNSNIINSLYHNFEVDLFDDEVEAKRLEYLKIIKKKWPEDTNFGFMIKMILMQIFSDDVMSFDIRLFYAQTRKLRSIVDKMIKDREAAKMYLPAETFKGSIKLGSESIEFEWVIRDFQKDEANPLSFFTKSLFTELNDLLIKRQHVSFYQQLDDLIKQFFNKKKELVVNYYKSKLGKSEEFQDQIAYDVLGIENKQDKFSSSFSLCLKKCTQCNFNCVRFLYHSGKCNCETDHKCKNICSVCKETKFCSFQNGHINSHLCDLPDHKCTEKCKVENCSNNCTNKPGHDGLCVCSNSHPCAEKCEMYSKCGQLCKFDLTKSHKQHTCNGKCPFKCIIDGVACNSTDHFHDFTLKEELIENYGNVKRHLCGKPHPCKAKCASSGICRVKTELVHRVYKNKYSEFTYPYVELAPEVAVCSEVIKPQEVTHANTPHKCALKSHLCDTRCPDCNCFCELAYGHGGHHSSSAHRNKECSEYISIEQTFSGVVKAENAIKTVTFVAGESASPEFCDQYCLTKGRGHSHPVICKGGDLCLEKTDIGFAIHSDKKFKSGRTEDVLYDFVTCDTYWKKYNWAPPNSQAVQSIFNKCNFSCEHQSHSDSAQKVFCEGKVFHSMSLVYSDHDFRCDHPRFSFYNIVFIVDCTGSMSSYFSGVQHVIRELISKWGSESNKFAFVGYTDHSPDNGILPASDPVCVFPSSKNLIDGDGSSVINFINGMKCSGGGGMLGEALIDGLAAANKLQFQKDSSKIYVLIADDSPHGDEFLAGTTYPSGCPCGIKWRDLLQFMKNQDVDFLFVKLSSYLNKTAELFSTYYGKKITVMPLNGVSEFKIQVLNKVSQTMETNFAFTNKEKK